MNSSEDIIKNPTPHPVSDITEEIQRSIDFDGQAPPLPSGFSQIIEAAENNQPDVVKQLLANGAKPSQTLKPYSVLSPTIQTETIDIDKMLLDDHVNVNARKAKRCVIPYHGAAVSISCSENASPLHYKHCYSKLVDLFIRFGENVNSSAYFESLSKALLTPLYVAEGNSLLDIVNILIENGGIVDTATNEGLSPLVTACINGFGEIAEILLENGACTEIVVNSKKNKGRTLLHVAAEGGNLLIVQMFLKRMLKIDFSSGKKTSLPVAVKKSRAELVKMLESDADVGSRVSTGGILAIFLRIGSIVMENILQCQSDVHLICNKSFLKIALMSYTHHDNVGKLVSYRFRLNYKDINMQSIVAETIKRGYYTIVKIFLQNGVLKRNYLHSAVRNNQYDTTEVLIEHGANVNEIYKGVTPLCQSVKHLDSKLSKLLLGASPEKVIDPRLLKCAVVWTALRNSSTDAIQCLLNYGVDVDAQCSDFGETTLHYAVSLHRRFHLLADEVQLAIVNLLLSKGACVNARTRTGSTPLHLAVFYNNGKVVKALLKYNANVSAPDQDGITPFHLSIERSNDIFEMLLTSSTNVDVQTNIRATPLHLATYQNNEKVVDSLLKFNANPNIADLTGLTPLHIAVFKKSLVITKMLVNANADVCVQTSKAGNFFNFPYNLPKAKFGTRPCSIAIPDEKDGLLALISPAYRFVGDPKDLTFLRPATRKLSVFSVLDIASMTNNLEIVEFLLKNNARIDIQDYLSNSVLHLSVVSDDHIDVVTLLLKNSADVNAKNRDGETPLLVALDNRCKELPKLLVSGGADVNAANNHNESPLLRAAEKCNFEVVEFLLRNGANVHVQDSSEAKTPLHYALLNKASDVEKIVEMLIKHGVDVNARCSFGKTVLHYASLKNGGGKIIEVLIKHGMDVNARCSSGKTALHYASFNRDGGKIGEMLIKYGVDVNARCSSGRTALYYASWGMYYYLARGDLQFDTKYGVDYHTEGWRRDGIVTVLLKNNAEVNAKDPLTETTALHIAAQGKDYRLFDILVQFNADVNLQDREGNTPLHLVTCPHIARVLLDSGANVNLKNVRNLTPYHSSVQRTYASLDSQIMSEVKKKRFYFEILERIFVEHLLKMKMARLFLDEMNLGALENSSRVDEDFLNECGDEIARMKMSTGGSNISFYDVLTRCSKKFAFKGEVVQALKSVNLKIEFPLYHGLFNWKLINRIRLLSDSMNIFKR